MEITNLAQGEGPWAPCGTSSTAIEHNTYALVRLESDKSNGPVLTTMPTGNKWASRVCHSGGAVPIFPPSTWVYYSSR
jgi:hypothetical protein